MRLELAEYPVRKVRFGSQTSYDRGVLAIDRDSLLSLLLQDKKVVSAELYLAHPGERTRIVQIRDVVEPRIKVSGPGCIFPGIMGPVETVGQGRTNRLSGMTVMVSAEYRPTILGGTARQMGGIVDMWGPGVQHTPYASTINLVPVLKLADDISELDAHATIQLAEFRVAHRLAEATLQKLPARIEAFDLSVSTPELPRVVYILGCTTQWHHPCDVAYYGLTIRESLSTLVHPNEFIDGAVTTDARRGRGAVTQTWEWMNSPIIFWLLREHGKRLNFAGVVLQRTRWETELGKKVSAVCASQMAKLAGAEGALITRKTPSGNNFMDAMLTVQACEQTGIKTVLVTPEWGGVDGTDLPLVFYVPEATSMVSTGSHDRWVRVPVPSTVIGVQDGDSVVPFPGEPSIAPRQDLVLDVNQLAGGIDWWGGMRLTCKQH